MRAAAGLILLLLLAAPLAAAAPLEANLTLPQRFAFPEATLLTGRLSFRPATLDEVVLLDARSLTLPPGELVVCPVETASTTEDVTTRRCSGGEAFDDARVTFGERTRLRFNVTFDAARFPQASVSTFVPTGATTAWAAAMSPDGVDLEWDARAVGFRPLGRAASVVVTAGDEVRWFNGSDYRFTFSPDGDASRLTARGDGIVARVQTDMQLDLARADPALLGPLLEPRLLLDAQEVHSGTDAREPIRNVTAILGSFSRAPMLLDAALVGHLNGTLGRSSPDPGVVTLVRLRDLDARLNGTTLSGAADARVVITPKGFAEADRAVSRPPVAVMVGAWVVALLLFLVVPWAPPRASAWARLARIAAALALLAAWDAVVQSALGFSAGSLLRGGATLASVAAVFAFEAVGVVLAWLLVGLPVRLAASRLLRYRSPAAAPYAPLVGTLALLAVMLLMPHALLNLAFLVAHF